MPPKASCNCGSCRVCESRVYMRNYYQSGKNPSYSNGGTTELICDYCQEGFVTTIRKAESGKIFCTRKCKDLAKRYRQHGLTGAQFRAMGDSCWICGSKDRVTLDHDHSCCPGSISCGECIRGILCSLCNSGLGYFKDNPMSLQRAQNYLKK